MHKQCRYDTWIEYRRNLIRNMGNVHLFQKDKNILYDILAPQKNVVLTTIEKVLENEYKGKNETEKQETIVAVKESFKKYICIKQEDHPEENGKLIIRSLKHGTAISERIASAYREACQDIVCIRIFNLQLVDYLVYCVRHLHDTLVDLQDIFEDIPKSEKIRIAMLCDYMLLNGNQYADKETREKFFYSCGSDQFEPIRQLDKLYPEYKKMLTCGLLSDRFQGKIQEFWEEIRMEYAWYIKEYAQFRELIFQQLRDVDLRDELKPEDQCLAAYYQIWKTALLRQDTEKIFQNNVDMIHHFQVQKKLEDIMISHAKMQKNIIKPDNNIPETPFILTEFSGKLNPIFNKTDVPTTTHTLTYDYIVRITDVHMLKVALLQIFSRYRKYQKWGIAPDDIWYRGHENAKYFLYPTIYRFYVEQNKNESRQNLVQYQRIMLNHYLSVAKKYVEAPELYPTKNENQQIEYLADMQHFQFKTNLMDWSDDIATALFFAIEANENQDSIENAALYLFHPILYNLVRKEIIAYFKGSSPKISKGKMGARARKDSIQRLRDSSEWTLTGLLPSMSPQFNQSASCFMDYIFGPQHADWTTECRDNPFETDRERSAEPPMLPIAVSLPRNNNRIRAQHGTMLAFNLCEQPLRNDGSIEKRYPHMELMEIQKFYQNDPGFNLYLSKKHWEKDSPLNEKVPFVYKLILGRSSYAEIRDFIKIMNKTKDNIYPSLEEAGENSGKKISELLNLV